MHRMGAQMHGLGANEPTCTPLATPLDLRAISPNDPLPKISVVFIEN